MKGHNDCRKLGMGCKYKIFWVNYQLKIKKKERKKWKGPNLSLGNKVLIKDKDWAIFLLMVKQTVTFYFG